MPTKPPAPKKPGFMDNLATMGKGMKAGAKRMVDQKAIIAKNPGYDQYGTKKPKK